MAGGEEFRLYERQVRRQDALSGVALPRFDYLSGFVQGVRGGLKFGVDRTTLLYTEKN